MKNLASVFQAKAMKKCNVVLGHMMLIISIEIY